MKYIDENEDAVKTVKEITMDAGKVVSLLEYINRGHIPDWNYSHIDMHGEDSLKESLPNSYYPLHAAMHIAAMAVEKLKNDEEFWNKVRGIYK